MDYFNPRSPHGERRGTGAPNSRSFLFQSTLPARGATCGVPLPRELRRISIHAPRTGSDGDHFHQLFTSVSFQSTLPARGATCCGHLWSLPDEISIHAPRTGSDVDGAVDVVRLAISIHAPRTGSDQRGQPRGQFDFISIHAPRTGSDCRGYKARTRADNFNPRSPHGERRLIQHPERRPQRFQSTLPARGATYSISKSGALMIFQSTLPARGATFGDALFELPQVHFNPRSPHGERQEFLDETYDYKPVNFNPRSPHGERPLLLIVGMRHENFNPRSPHGERLAGIDDMRKTLEISIHAPRTGSDVPTKSAEAKAQQAISIHAPRTGSDCLPTKL